MIDDRDLPASNDRLADELKTAVLVALFGLVALGASDALVARDDAPITREVAAHAPSQRAAPYLPGELRAEATEIEPQAPTF